MENRLNIDIRDVISSTLYYIASKTGRKIIAFDEIIKYIQILEKKYNTKFKITNLSNYNNELYEKCIITHVKDDNIYFILKPLCWNLLYTNIAKKNLLLKEKYPELINNKITEEMQTIYKDQISEQKIINHPNKTIPFESLFKLFMFECNRLGINSINKEQFWNTIYKIIDTLRYLNIHVTQVNKLKLFRIIYQTNTSQKYDMKNGNINLHLIDKKQYCVEIAREFNKETYDLVSSIIKSNIYDINENKRKVYTKRER